MTTSAFLSQWTSSVVPTLVASFIGVTTTLVGLSMLIGYAVKAVRAS